MLEGAIYSQWTASRGLDLDLSSGALDFGFAQGAKFFGSQDSKREWFVVMAGEHGARGLLRIRRNKVLYLETTFFPAGSNGPRKLSSLRILTLSFPGLLVHDSIEVGHADTFGSKVSWVAMVVLFKSSLEILEWRTYEEVFVSSRMLLGHNVNRRSLMFAMNITNIRRGITSVESMLRSLVGMMKPVDDKNMCKTSSRKRESEETNISTTK